MTNQEEMIEVKVYCWSQGASEWMYYGDFSSIKEIEAHIETSGFDKRFFKY